VLNPEDIANETSKIVYVSTNRGMSIKIFSHPKFGRMLRAMGLREWSAFGCIFNYLFRPSSEALHAFGGEFSILKSQKKI